MTKFLRWCDEHIVLSAILLCVFSTLFVIGCAYSFYYLTNDWEIFKRRHNCVEIEVPGKSYELIPGQTDGYKVFTSISKDYCYQCGDLGIICTGE